MKKNLFCFFIDEHNYIVSIISCSRNFRTDNKIQLQIIREEGNNIDNSEYFNHTKILQRYVSKRIHSVAKR